jgi:enamine deaminase RidA (YjgF/YER057c/UK114 family)
MPVKQVISTKNAPQLPGIYNQAVVANGTVYCSGTIGIDPATGKSIEGDVQDRTVSMMEPRFQAMSSSIPGRIRLTAIAYLR